jgi:hypothetical protein
MKVSIQELRMLTLALGVSVAAGVSGQAPAPAASATLTAPSTAPTPATIAQLDWLHGCWDGKVNSRDFREEWLPLSSETMIGASQTVMDGKMQDFEYLRLETRADGVYYVAAPSGKNETAFRLTGKTVDGDDQMFTFDNPAGEFPQRIVYRQGTKGWLYAEVQGTIKGQDHKVIYPMRRVDCQSGEIIEK